jgi:hypothetical protein
MSYTVRCIPARSLVWCNYRWERGSHAPYCPDVYRPLPDCGAGIFHHTDLSRRPLHPPHRHQLGWRKALGKKIKDTARSSGEIFDKIIGIVVVIIGIYFLCLAFQ